MRILVYTTQIRFPGGYENLALTLAETLDRRSIPVFLLSHYSADFVIEGDRCPPRDLHPDLPAHHLGVPTKPSLWDVARAAVRLRRIVRTLRIDAIEVSGRGPSVLAILATLGMGIRVIVGVHAVASSPGRTAAGYWLWRMICTLSRSVCFFGVSQAASMAWLRFTSCSSDRVTTVYNSINEQFFLPTESCRDLIRKELGCTRRDRVVLCVGRLLVSKGQITVAQALLPILVEHNLRLVFVGRKDTEPGDDGSRISQLVEGVAAGPLHDRVSFIGTRQDMPHIMGAADFLVHVPSNEAFGLVVAEAMAVGLPIIATNIGGIPEVVAGTDTILVPPEDPLALRNAFLECLAWSDERRAECIRKGRERAMDFHPDRRADQILALLQGSRH